MDSSSLAQLSLSGDPGMWIGFLLSLMVFSLIIGDNILARLAQYILVGATLGYLASLTLYQILWQRLFVPFIANPGDDPGLIIAILLIVLLLGTGTERLWGDPTLHEPPQTNGQHWLKILGMLPVALLLGVGIAVAITGAIQGTLLPQFWRAASMGLPWQEAGSVLLTGALTLLISTGVMLHLYARGDESISARMTTTDHAEQSPSAARPLPIPSAIFWAWTALGKRALWLTAGMIFARLLAARFSLFIARVEYFRSTLEATGIWGVAESIWLALSR